MSESSDSASPAGDAPSAFDVFDEFLRRLVVVRRAGDDCPREGWSHEQREIARVLGKALGYPAADDGTVCTGEHSALSLVTEAAGRIGVLTAEVERLRADSGRLAPTEAAEVRIEVARLCAENEKLRNRSELPRVCVAIVVQRSGEVLLLKRGPGCTWPGTWCLPGGHIELGETINQCLDRELWEETGLCADAYRLARITEDIDDHGHMIGLVYEALMGDPPLDPENREPDKHADMRWFSWGRFPRDLMPGTRRWAEKFHVGSIYTDDN